MNNYKIRYPLVIGQFKYGTLGAICRRVNSQWNNK
jgi:hypothetical protein